MSYIILTWDIASGSYKKIRVGEPNDPSNLTIGPYRSYIKSTNTALSILYNDPENTFIYY